jgi:hypothetical protein
MPQPPKKKPSQIKIDLPQAEFPVHFYATLAGIEWIDTHPLIHFGLFASSQILSCFAIMLEYEVLQVQKDNWGEYYGKIGGGEQQSDRDFSFRCPSTLLKTPVSMANVALWSRQNEVGEIRFYGFSHGDAFQAVPEKRSSISGQALALIRMPLPLHIQILASLLARA